MRKIIIVVVACLQFACSGLDKNPELSEQGQVVELLEAGGEFPADCRRLGKVYGYGTFETEALNDLRHNAAEEKGANAVGLIYLKDYFQNKRITNYLRTPELKQVRKGTTNYKYDDAFTFKAKGEAFICR